VRVSGVVGGARPRVDALGISGVVSIGALAGCLWREPIVLATLVVLTLVAIEVCRVDLASRRIPNELVAAAALFTLAGATVGWLTGSSLWPVWIGAVVGGGPVLVFHIASPAGMGFGDVKWATALGAAVGLVGWQLAVLVPLVGSLLAVVTAAATRQRRIAFGPTLSAGALFAVTLGPVVMGSPR
jgi:leader peptidase (prepilin peptidase)/N-methyltransferase